MPQPAELQLRSKFFTPSRDRYSCALLGDRGRRPDVAYLTPELVAQFADVAVLPQSFPLIAEIASPDDSAEELFAKAKEYLQSGCQEVWLVFPETQWILVITTDQRLVFTSGEMVSAQKVLQGFTVSVDELLT